MEGERDILKSVHHAKRNFKRFTALDISRLPEYGTTYNFAKVLGTSYINFYNWMKADNFNSYKLKPTQHGKRLISKSEFVAWLKKDGRLKDF